MFGRLGRRTIRREPVVHRHHALVGYHVAGHSAAHEHRVQPLVVPQPVHHRLARLVGPEHVEHSPGQVDGVRAHPGPRGVRPLPRHRHRGAQRALAATLDLAGRRLEQDREVAGERRRVDPGQPRQPTAGGLDLFAVVEHVRHVVHGRRHGGGEPQLHRDTRLHVGRPAPVQPVPADRRGQVVRDRHGVDVPGQHHPPRTSQRGTRDQRVAVTVQRQPRQLAERGLDGVGQHVFRAADRRNIHQRGGQRCPGRGEIKVHPGSLRPIGPTACPWPPRAALARSPRPKAGARSPSAPPRRCRGRGRVRAAAAGRQLAGRPR